MVTELTGVLIAWVRHGDSGIIHVEGIAVKVSRSQQRKGGMVDVTFTWVEATLYMYQQLVVEKVRYQVVCFVTRTFKSTV